MTVFRKLLIFCVLIGLSADFALKVLQNVALMISTITLAVSDHSKACHIIFKIGLYLDWNRVK